MGMKSTPLLVLIVILITGVQCNKKKQGPKKYELPPELVRGNLVTQNIESEFPWQVLDLGNSNTPGNAQVQGGSNANSIRPLYRIGRPKSNKPYVRPDRGAGPQKPRVIFNENLGKVVPVGSNEVVRSYNMEMFHKGNPNTDYAGSSSSVQLVDEGRFPSATPVSGARPPYQLTLGSAQGSSSYPPDLRVIPPTRPSRQLPQTGPIPSARPSHELTLGSAQGLSDRQVIPPTRPSRQLPQTRPVPSARPSHELTLGSAQYASNPRINPATEPSLGLSLMQPQSYGSGRDQSQRAGPNFSSWDSDGPDLNLGDKNYPKKPRRS